MKQKRKIFQELAQDIKTKKHCCKKLKSIIKDIKNQNFDLNTKIYRGRTLIHYAVKANEKGYVKLLIKSGVNPQICDDDYNTPLLFSIINDCYQAANELLKAGVDVNMAGEFEQTPLHIACVYGNLDMVKLLIKHKADVNLVDERNLNPYDYAIDEENEAIINYFKNIMGGYKK